MNPRRLSLILSLVTFLAGVTVAAVPAEVIAENCSADNGASCECDGECEHTKLYCWCKPPAE